MIGNVVLYFDAIHCMMLTDYQYWASLEDELDAWLDTNTVDAIREGMIISNIQNSEYMMFKLKWE